MCGESSAAERATLHDFVAEYAKVLAEVFGWRVVTAPGAKRGADAVIEHVVGGRRDAVLLVESEVGHDAGSAKEYFERLCERHGELVEECGDGNVEHIGSDHNQRA